MSKVSATAARKGRVAAPAVSGLHDHLGFWLRYVSNHVSARFARMLADEGLSTSDWVVLRMLFDAEARTPSELIAALGMTKSAVSKIVSRLEGKGLVARAAASGDARAQQVVLADAGQAVVPALAALADENDEVFFGHLTPQQRAGMVEILRGIVETRHLRDLPVE